MSSGALEDLKAHGMGELTTDLANAPAVRDDLLSSGKVAELREALLRGEITEETIGRFVASLLQHFQTGEEFPNELALAGLAVALENHPAQFAEEYLRDLAQLHVAELRLSSHVARECLRKRSSVYRKRGKVIQLVDLTEQAPNWSDWTPSSVSRHSPLPPYRAAPPEPMDWEETVAPIEPRNELGSHPAVEYFLVAEATALDQDTNKLSVFNILNHVVVPRLPSTIPNMVALSCWICSEAQRRANQEYTTTLLIRPAGGRPPREFRARFRPESKYQYARHEVRGMPVDEPGEAIFELWLDGQKMTEHRLTISSS